MEYRIKKSIKKRSISEGYCKNSKVNYETTYTLQYSVRILWWKIYFTVRVFPYTEFNSLINIKKAVEIHREFLKITTIKYKGFKIKATITHRINNPLKIEYQIGKLRYQKYKYESTQKAKEEIEIQIERKKISYIPVIQTTHNIYTSLKNNIKRDFN